MVVLAFQVCFARAGWAAIMQPPTDPSSMISLSVYAGIEIGQHYGLADIGRHVGPGFDMSLGRLPHAVQGQCKAPSAP